MSSVYRYIFKIISCFGRGMLCLLRFLNFTVEMCDLGHMAVIATYWDKLNWNGYREPGTHTYLFQTVGGTTANCLLSIKVYFHCGGSLDF